MCDVGYNKIPWTYHCIQGIGCCLLEFHVSMLLSSVIMLE